MVEVVDGTSAVSVETTATCALGGSSVPMLTYVSYAPFADLTITLGLTEAEESDDDSEEEETDPSEGLTVDTSLESIAFSTDTMSGYLGFDCASEIGDSVTLTYTLSGTNSA